MKKIIRNVLIKGSIIIGICILIAISFGRFRHGLAFSAGMLTGMIYVALFGATGSFLFLKRFSRFIIHSFIRLGVIVAIFFFLVKYLRELSFTAIIGFTFALALLFLESYRAWKLYRMQ